MIDDNVLRNAITALTDLQNALQNSKSVTANSADAENLVEFANVLEEATSTLETIQVEENSDSAIENSGLLAASSSEEAVENLLVASESEAKINKPTLAEFMSASGLNSADASDMLYGIIGSNADLRNWSKIMSNGNVLEDTRTATRQLFESDFAYHMANSWESKTANFADAKLEHNVSSFNVVQQNSRFSDLNINDSIHTYITDKNGLILRGAGSTAEQIKHTAWLYGIDL